MKKVLLCSAVVLACVASRSNAQEFQILGARPLGMGGAFVAVADNALAQYWNPAGLGPQTNFDIQVPVNVRVEFTGGILNDANNITNAASDINRLQSAFNGNIQGLDANNFNSLLTDINNIQKINQPGTGALANVDGGVNARIGRIAVSVNNFTTLGVIPHADTTDIGFSGISFAGSATLNDFSLRTTRNTLQNVLSSNNNFGIAGNSQNIANALINNAQANGASNASITSAVNTAASNTSAQSILAASAGTSFNNNNTNLQLKGGSFTEAAFGYAHTLFLKDLYLGGNLKVINGQVGFLQEDIINNTNTSDPVNNFLNNSKTTVKPSIDLGLLYDKRKEWKTRFGLVGKDLNSPSFAQPQAGVAQGLNPVKLDSQFRAGVAVYPTNFWIIAMDLDLTNNPTIIDGYTSRMWGVGTEVNIFNRPWLNIPLLAGVMKNLSESGSNLTYTAGAGLNFLHVVFEVSGAISSQTVNINSDSTPTTVPTNASVAATLSVLFGGHKA